MTRLTSTDKSLEALAEARGFTYPTGPVWERMKSEKLWTAFRCMPPDTPGKKHHKKPVTGQGWNLPRRLMSFEEAAVSVEGSDNIFFAYLPCPGSAVTAIDVDLTPDDKLSDFGGERALRLPSYQERSVSGLGTHVLIARPPDIEAFMHDPSGPGLGYLGNETRVVVLTFQSTGGTASIEPVGGEVVRTIHEAARLRPAPPPSPDMSEPSPTHHWFARLGEDDRNACLRDMLKHINLDRNDRYDDWYQVGMGVLRSGSLDAEDIWEEWSSGQPGYDPREDFDKKMGSFHDREGGITVGKLIYLAVAGGWQARPWQRKAEAEQRKSYLEALERLRARTAAKVEAPAPEPDPEDPDSLRAMLGATVAPVAWRVEDLIGPELTLAVGRPKVGKGFLGLQIAERVGTGQPLFELPTRKGKVLCYFVEDGRDVVTRRVQAMKLDPTADVIFRWKGGEDLDDYLGMLAAELEADPAIDTVIIDTLRYVIGEGYTRGSRYQNAADRDFQTLKPIKELCIAAGVALVAVMHERKDPSGRRAHSMDMFDAISGSQLLPATAQSIFRLLRDEGATTARLQRAGRLSTNNDTLRLFFDPERQRWGTISEAMSLLVATLEKSRANSATRDVIEMLTTAGEAGLTRTEVRARLAAAGRTPEAIQRTLHRLIEAGVVSEDGTDDLAVLRVPTR